MKEIILFFATFTALALATKKRRSKKDSKILDLAVENELIQRQLLEDYLQTKNFN